MKTCPFCRRRFTLDAGVLPYHEHGGVECAGAYLPPECAQEDKDAADAEPEEAKP
jgi:hypothetical protein